MADTEEPMEQETETEQASTLINRGIPEYAEIVVPPAPEKVATYDVNGPRLMITHITNVNFKSYAGKQMLGPFHKSFSSIVGPNGSGKSNVIDSMLFVFGYRANKIRSKKISVLIHNSENHRTIESCTVSVHFQKIIDTGSGDDDYDVVPNSQFVVSRTASKDNSSSYAYNGKKATYKEVAALLRGSGIDLDHNRFLILQGEVEQIAMMKPKAQSEHDEGMLEFLEDIIGSSRFKEPIELLTKRVEELNDFRVEKLNRVKAVEKEKDDLEGVKNEAIEYLTLENQIIKKKNVLYQKYVYECSINQEKASEKRDEIKEGMKDVTDKLAEINENKKAKGKELKKISKKYEELNKKCDEKKQEFTEFETQDVKCREDLKHSKSKGKKLEKGIEAEKKKVEELKLVPERSEQEVKILKVKLEKLEKEKEKEEENLAKVMESLKTETLGLQEEKDKKEKELITLQEAVNETKSTLNVAQSELDLYLTNQRNETKKLQEAERNLEKTVTILKERHSAIEELEQRIPSTQRALEQAKKDLEKSSTAEQKISQEVRNTRLKVEEMRSALSASKSRGRVIDALMAEKKSGRIPGIYGRLGDLGGIDEEYDVAISTACGALDNIVVDTISSAQKCVEYLKKSGVGSATFIGLEKMERWRHNASSTIKTPESVPRLFDLVKSKDEKVKTAFYFALRDTLVARDLDQATRIAYGKQRYRVVTLQGQLIDQSGTMSGGGNRVSRGRMGSTVVQEEEADPNKLIELENNLKKASTEAQHCLDNKFKLEETVRKMERELSQMKNSLEKFSADLKGLNEQEVTLKQQVKDQAEKVKAAAPDAKTLKDLEKKVDAFQKDFNKARSAAEEVEAAVKDLHEQIMDIGGAKLKAVETRINTINGHIDTVTGQITKCNVAVKTAARNIKKSEEKAAGLEEEIQENKEHIEELETKFKKLEEEATKVLESYQEAQEQMKAIEEALGETQQEVNKLEEDENKLQKDNIEIKHELEKYETVVKDNALKIKHWKKEIGKLSLHQVESQEGAEKELATVAAEELINTNKEDTQYEITVMEEKIAQMKPNMAAIVEYKKKEEMYLKRVAELDQITDLRDQQRKLHEDLRKQRLDEFMASFSVITNKLKEMYQMITLGGDAELELVDSLDPFSEGIVFSVRPPKKSWKNISNLSGGEKTLSSLALVFALHHYKPTPLYVMDEIDAALDFKNVSIVANYIKERTKNAQFIIISLRNNMFELADRLVGIYKTDNCTKSVTINPKKLSIPLGEITNKE